MFCLVRWAVVASTAFRGDECAGSFSELPSHVLLGDSGQQMCLTAAALGGAVSCPDRLLWFGCRGEHCPSFPSFPLVLSGHRKCAGDPALPWGAQHIPAALLGGFEPWVNAPMSVSWRRQ